MVSGFTVGILTVSDRSARGERADTSGPALREMLTPLGTQVVRYEIVPDDRGAIENTLRRWADEEGIALILTTGGTGLGPRDVTPEGTRAVIEKEVPGLAEAMRAAGLKKTPHAMLSRALAGVRGQSLIINLPGSPRGARECLEAVLPALPHAVELLHGGGAETHSAPGSQIPEAG